VTRQCGRRIPQGTPLVVKAWKGLNVLGVWEGQSDELVLALVLQGAWTYLGACEKSGAHEVLCRESHQWLAPLTPRCSAPARLLERTTQCSPLSGVQVEATVGCFCGKRWTLPEVNLARVV
jgi:hypothetical protein